MHAAGGDIALAKSHTSASHTECMIWRPLYDIELILDQLYSISATHAFWDHPDGMTALVGAISGQCDCVLWQEEDADNGEAADPTTGSVFPQEYHQK